MDSQHVTALRTKLGDREAANVLYKQDPGFKERLDYVRSNVQGNINPLKEQAIYKQTLDAHYNGKRFGRQNNSVFMAALEGGDNTSSAAQDPQDKFSFMRMAKNIPSSAAQFVGDIASGVKNVVNPNMEQNTLANLGKMILGAGGNSVETVAGALGVENAEELLNLPGEELASAVGKFYADRYGGLDKTLQTVETDPVGFLSDISTLVTGGASAVAKGAAIAGKTGKIAKIASKTAKIAANIDPAYNVMRGAKLGAKAITSTGKFAISQATGLSGDTISTILRNDKFGVAKSGKITRPSLASKVKSAIKSISDELDETGKAYDPIIKGKGSTKLPEGWLDNFLRNEGFTVKKGIIKQTLDTPAQLSDGELAALNKFYKSYGKKTNLTANQFLNLRRRIGKMRDFDKTIDTRSLEALSGKIYDELNTAGRDQILGLRELDEKFAPQRKELRLLEKEFIDPNTGELRDTVMNRIATATGKGKDQFLARVRKLVPEIEDEINALRAIEDVDFGGTKVGTYTRSILQSGGIAAGALSGNPLLVIGAIAASPSIAVPILQTYAKVARVPARTIRAITQKIKLGKKLTDAQKAIMSEALRHATIPENQDE